MNKIPIINQIIKNKRKFLKLNQSEFAELINKSLPMVKKYDTGTLIPENTLILICDKLIIDINTILKKQLEENKKYGDIFYCDIIKKRKISDIKKSIDGLKSILEKESINTSFLNKNDIDTISMKLNILLSDIEKLNEELLYKRNLFCFVENEKIYIENYQNDEIILTLNITQAKKFLKDMNEYFDYLLFKLIKDNKKNNNEK